MASISQLVQANRKTNSLNSTKQSIKWLHKSKSQWHVYLSVYSWCKCERLQLNCWTKLKITFFFQWFMPDDVKYIVCLQNIIQPGERKILFTITLLTWLRLCYSQKSCMLFTLLIAWYIIYEYRRVGRSFHLLHTIHMMAYILFIFNR